MKNLLINSCIIFVLVVVLIQRDWKTRDTLYEKIYDWSHSNETVTSKSQVEKLLNDFTVTDYNSLDQDYLEYTKSNLRKYKELVSQLTYFRIQRRDLNKKIVGNFRLKEFICRDKYYKECILNKRSEIICIFNKKIFFKTLELQDELENLGHDKTAFTIVNGHRHPGYNEKIKGAKLSRHIKGEAVDIKVHDINRDGYADKADKDIILDLLEKKIIKDKGGIGLYPGTDNVHYDVRGTKARWNSY